MLFLQLSSNLNDFWFNLKKTDFVLPVCPLSENLIQYAFSLEVQVGIPAGEQILLILFCHGFINKPDQGAMLEGKIRMTPFFSLIVIFF